MIKDERREEEEEHCAKDQRNNNSLKHCNTPFTDSVTKQNELNMLEVRPPSTVYSSRCNVGKH